MSPVAASKPDRPTQAHRRARTRAALLESAAQGLSRYGYTDLVLERVASEAGYSRGALYHLFANKEELALAVVKWVEQTWYEELGDLFADDTDPVEALIALARGYAIFCRRDAARVMMTLRAEFEGRDHPVGQAVQAAMGRVIEDSTRLITAGRSSGAIPPGPPPETLARAYIGAIEGLAIYLAGEEPFDVVFAQRTALGVLGLTPMPDSPSTE